MQKGCCETIPGSFEDRNGIRKSSVHLTWPTLKLVDHWSMQSFKREVLIWKRLEHENILPLFGITLIDGVPCTVSEWMENGTMVRYLAVHTGVDILGLVCTYPVRIPVRYLSEN